MMGSLTAVQAVDLHHGLHLHCRQLSMLVLCADLVQETHPATERKRVQLTLQGQHCVAIS